MADPFSTLSRFPTKSLVSRHRRCHTLAKRGSYSCAPPTLSHFNRKRLGESPKPCSHILSGPSGPAAAAESFEDVISRSVTIDSIVENPRMLTLMGLPQVNFGADIVAKSEAVIRAVEQEQ